MGLLGGITHSLMASPARVCGPCTEQQAASDHQASMAGGQALLLVLHSPLCMPSRMSPDVDCRIGTATVCLQGFIGLEQDKKEGNAQTSGFKSFMSTFGAVPVTGKNFFKLLRNGEAVLLYPGGVREVGAEHWETTAAVLLDGLSYHTRQLSTSLGAALQWCLLRGWWAALQWCLLFG